MATQSKLKKWVLRIIKIAIVVIMFFIPQLISVPYFLHLIIYTMIWVIMTSGLNVIQGFGGYASLCQSAFYGLGAYTSALLFGYLHWSMAAGLVASIIMGIVVGTLVGLPTLKTKGHYFSIATIAFTMLFYTLVRNWNGLTNGIQGYSISKIKGSIFGYPLSERTGYYYIVLVITLLTLLFVKLLFNSRAGRAIVTIRENENLAKALGINLVATKVMAFDISAVLGCIAGTLFAHYFNYVTPTSFAAGVSLNAILAVMAGGTGTIFGPVFGSILVILVPELLRVAEMYRQLVFGLLMILIVFVLPNGIIKPITSLFTKIRKKPVSQKADN